MTNPNLSDWTRFHGTFGSDPNKKVERIDFQFDVKDTVSTTDGVNRKPIFFTDIQFQAGNQLSGWNPNTKEMLQRLTWTHDENTYVASPNQYAGDEPRVYENVDRRWFNIVGRGHRTIVVPNYLPEDWDVPILPTGIDLTLYPKEDFDLLRVSTNSGATIPEENQLYKEEGGLYREIESKYNEVTSSYFSGDSAVKTQEIANWENVMRPLFASHPLHTRYTREFFVEGGSAGSEIKIHATPHVATFNGKDIQIVGQRSVKAGDHTIKIDRKKFQLAPKGTATIRIEFYKLRERSITTYDRDSNYNLVKKRKKFKYLEDAGVGYYGTASFFQWTHGRSRM